jgi:hypothetical protein
LYRASRRAIVVEAARKEGKGSPPTVGCLSAPVCQTETGLTYNARRVRRAELSAPPVACLSRILGVVAVVVRPLRRECVHAVLPCPASLSACGMARACSTRERHGARRGRGTRDSDVSSANLVSQWMEGPVGRGRERVGGWPGFHSKSLAHVFVQLTTVPRARSSTIIVRRCSPA